jgi:phosphoenolpyruvate synthase/pyruvate phosphate dikinase
VVFSSEEAVEWALKGEKVILVREETSPEDVDGMHKSGNSYYKRWYDFSRRTCC